jgi:hypothetical protein
MLGSRTLLAVLVLLHVGLASAAAVQSVDFAWIPSYFDDDDGDFLPLLLSEQTPALLAPVRDWTPLLVALAALLTGRLLGQVRPAATPARFRAPPCR